MLRALALAAAWLFATNAAADSPSLDLFRSACVESGADQSAAAATLQHLGWRPLSEAEMIAHPQYEIARGFTMHWSGAAAWAPVEDASQSPLVLTGVGPVGNGSGQGAFCLFADDTPFRRRLSEVESWLGFPPAQTWGPGGAVFAYMRDSEGGFHSAAGLSRDEGEQPLAEGRIGFIQVVGDARRSNVMFSVVRPASAAPQR